MASNINLSLTNINSGRAFMKRKINEADLSQGGRISLGEMAEATGLGTSTLRKVFGYAANIEFYGEGKGASSVDVSVMKKAIDKISATLKKTARTKGNKDKRLQGNEMKYLKGDANKALVRLIHNLKLAGEI